MFEVQDDDVALAHALKDDGDRGLAALLMQSARRRQQNQKLKARLLAANGDCAIGIELANRVDDAQLFVAILEEPDGSGKGRVVNFQSNGLHGHQVYASPEAALEEAIKDGYRWQVTVLDAFSGRREFHKGQRLVDLIYGFNTGRLDRAAFDAAVRELDQELDRLYGVQEAA